MKAEIISVGTELLLGEIADANAPFLASQLPSLGIDLYWISQVGDNPVRLVEALKRAWQRSEIILVTGGLGPTQGDITRESIAEMLGEKMAVVPDLERELRGFFLRRGMEMPLSNLKQATLIPSAQAIPNQYGTAPGWWVEKDKHILIAMPGPPREMQPMWREQILPQLQRIATDAVLVSRTIKTAGLGEGTMAERISSLFSSTNPTLGIYAKVDGIHLRLAAKAPSRQQAEEIMAPVEARIRSLLSEYIWGTDGDTLEGVLGRMLVERGWSLAVMEGYTGGLLTTAFAEASAAAAFFKGGLVANTDEALIAYGVDAALIAQYGASSPEVVSAMAEAARLRLGATIGVGVTGADEPKEVEKRPFRVMYLAVDGGESKRVLTDYFPGTRAQVKRRAVLTALLELRKLLVKPV